MKCPRCGELWFDREEEYSLEVCPRCEDDPDEATPAVTATAPKKRRKQTNSKRIGSKQRRS
jgi:acetyl-CoA carboxylase beta subunit